MPGWSFEHHLSREGYRSIAGLDEAGRGCLAGPVVAAAVILRPGEDIPGVNDSKLLTPAQRESMLRVVLRKAEAFGIGAADAEEIDRINILNATYRAMERAVAALILQPDHLLIDAVRLKALPIPQTSIIRGDQISVSIAAASILAKVVRDRVMEFYDRRFMGFGFASHKGYGTPQHLRAVAARGACPIHRLTFKGIRPDSQLSLAFESRPGGAA